MPKRERSKPQRRRRERVESTVQPDEQYSEAKKEVAPQSTAAPSSPPKPEVSALRSQEQELQEPMLDKIYPDEGAKTFGPNEEGWVTVEIADDKQQAAVTALHFGDKKVKAQIFVDALRDQFKLVHGLKKQALKELISQARKEAVVRGNVVVAEATAAKPGKDGSVKLEFQQGLDENAKLTFSELCQALQAEELATALELDVLSILVCPGQTVATLTPPTDGEPAIDVFGSRELKPGTAAKLGCGDNVGLEEGAYVAQIYGYVCCLKDEISVLPPVWVSKESDEAHFLHLPQAVAAKPPDPDWLLQSIKLAGVTAGIDEAALEKLSREMPAATERTNVLVAKG
jgi:uncharacterized protein (DUF342 family)